MKYILLTDIHFGNKGNSDDFNQQCLDFLDFVEEKTCDMEIDGAIFLGDWYHNRNAINVKTLKYGIEGIYKLGNIGQGNSYMILGNHDLYYKDRRDVSSIIVPEGDIGVQVIDEPIMVDNLLLCPWLIGDEKIPQMIEEHKPSYIFCHPEIPSFSFNKSSKYEGEFDPQEYSGVKRICCGHFHMRQEKNNITYIGNCFSHDFSDVNDWHNKGFAILDTETNNIEYYEWEDAPKYCITKISQLNSIEFGSNMYLKLINDVNMKPLDLNKLTEQLEQIPSIKDCMVYPNELSLVKEAVDEAKIENIENIDTLITELLSSMDMENINSNDLVNLYRNLQID